MATIQQTITLNDKMSSTLSSIVKAMHSTLSAMQSVEKQNGNMGSAFKKAQANVNEAERQLKQFDNQVNKTNSVMTKGSSTASSFFKALLGAQVVQKGLSMITSQLNNAIDRFDTLNNYVKVMGNLGIDQKAAEASKTRLSEGLKGLPTTLNDAVIGVEKLTAANSDVEASTEMFLAMNNAILAGGASMQVQSSALEQLTQAYAKGKPDMMEWRALQTAMPGQLKQIAKAMGKTTTRLGQDLRSGKTSMNDFMKTAVELNQKGIDGFKNFEQQAKDATGGINTSIANMQAAISRGWVKMIEGANKGLQASGLPTIQEIITNIGTAIEDLLTRIGEDLIPSMGSAFDDLAGYFRNTEEAATTSAQNSLDVWDYFMIGFNTLILGIEAAVGSLKVVWLTIVLGAQTFALGVLGVFNGLKTGVQLIMLGILKVVQDIINGIVDLLNNLIEAFNNTFEAFGANVQQVQKVTFANEYAEKVAGDIKAGNENIQGLRSAMDNTVNQINEAGAQNQKNWAASSDKYWDALNKRINKVTDNTKKSSTTKAYNPSNIDKLGNTVGTDKSGGKAVKTTSKDKLIESEDIKLLLDVATRDYKLNYQQITPSITVTFGDVRETADVDDILDQVADKLEEIYDGNLGVG